MSVVVILTGVWFVLLNQTWVRSMVAQTVEIRNTGKTPSHWLNMLPITGESMIIPLRIKNPALLIRLRVVEYFISTWR
ncbi:MULTISPECIES: hypothetical protein [Butyricimonas]|uniref:hypothetical protein n=1 Tax=Butyricimonas TaxID=574697 RepID=UPI001651C28C|nr:MULTISPECIES: hypothetical protein [Butyricimonas]